MNTFRQTKKADIPFRVYVNYFNRRLENPAYEQEIRHDALEQRGGYKQREAYTIMEQVVSINARRQAVVEGVKKKAREKGAYVHTVLVALEKSISFRVKILKDPKTCCLTQTLIPFPREITCDYDYTGASSHSSPSTFVVRSDFVPILRSYFILYHFPRYIQYSIDKAERMVDERFINEQYRVFMHCMKQCKMVTEACTFYVEDGDSSSSSSSSG